MGFDSLGDSVKLVNYCNHIGYYFGARMRYFKKSTRRREGITITKFSKEIAP